MPESLLEVKDICDSGECRTPLMGPFSQSSLPLQRRTSYILSTFCTEHNVQECLLRITQEVASLGLPPVLSESGSSSEMNVVAVLNCMHDLIQLYHRSLRSLETLELEQHKSSSNVEYLQLTSTRLKEQLETSKRENTGLLERERRLQMKTKTLQHSLKNEKEEVQKLQNIIASRASQYNHEMKRKEREFNKLKERLNQLLTDKREKKQAIDVLNSIGRADGKRSLWKTDKTEAKHEGQLFQTLLSDYEARQRELLLENAEVNKVLQQMKGEMTSILRSNKSNLTGDTYQDDVTQAESEEEEEVFDSSKERVELFCVHAREKLTNSIRLQWRKLKNHVERLDSQASLSNTDVVSRENHVEEVDKLKLEIQQCKDLIQTQQQLLNQQLSSQCDEDEVSVYENGPMLKEEKNLRQEWKVLEEQRKIFERERRNFTEAAIRLSNERKSFEEDRATWLKHQFLNSSPFSDSVKPPMTKSKSAFLMFETTPETIVNCKLETIAPSTSCASLSPTSSETADVFQTHRLIPQNSCGKPKKKAEEVEESLS
ncbi:afadin- and alpha-actinin-binding protein-like isoform X2 [Takifugu rubripes]|uniref:afadin- and alpha-actinin-binding protein-like isoform X2 n=1 Tax=Takifugu rubripes TaxID=31033 RepID=UPI0005D13A80|nr:afadin- and alpha-actinin-binding protein-like isoform X2 [Takifugu rubripes]XP_029683867.1 afadin- and alpha-actinin-binding protein-like isoform X2 [Takifugu rubripes]|eukprot:XP_011613234.1 PREDICTED: afadin- and alpha-actinin-binding protein-like isoform X1 [Takifugu rubripes]